MNERIRELMAQSGLQPYYDAQEGQMEKFAELVIMECTKFLDEQSDRDDFVAKVAPLLRKN